MQCWTITAGNPPPRDKWQLVVSSADHFQRPFGSLSEVGSHITMSALSLPAQERTFQIKHYANWGGRKLL